jgi:hypothetical protein
MERIMTRLSLDISDQFHHKLKMLTTWKGVSIKDFVIQALNKQMELEYTPPISKNVLNEETIKGIEESRQGIGLTICNSTEEFLAHLDKLEQEAKQELIEDK